MRRLLFAVFLMAAAALASASGNAAQLCPNDSTGHPVPSCAFAGNSLSVTQQNGVGLVDVSFPVFSPPAGNYAPLYAGSTSGTATDDFATLKFTGAAAATYTMPPSHVTNFTGSISGTTLTVPSGTVIAVGDVITNAAGTVAANTAVKSGAGTTWTISLSQTVSSTTLTATSFPPGHGVCFKNNGTAVLTVTATTSTIYGAPGNTSGNPIALGGPLSLLPGGESCLQSDSSNNYAVSGFLAGAWFQNAAGASSLLWTGLSGYEKYDLDCMGVVPNTSGDSLMLRVAYDGTLQATTGTYNWVAQHTTQGVAALTVDSPAVGPPDTTAGIRLTGGIANTGPGTFVTGAGANLTAHLTFSDGTGAGFRRSVMATAGFYGSSATAEQQVLTSGAMPKDTTAHSITGLQLIMAGGSTFLTGACWLHPAL